jgi:hypothetical protein
MRSMPVREGVRRSHAVGLGVGQRRDAGADLVEHVLQPAPLRP